MAPAANQGAVRNAQDGEDVLLDVRDISVSYARSVQALREVSMSVPTDAVAAVLGGNGAGKSTLLRAISGTLPSQRGSIDRGSVWFDARELTRLDAADIARMGVVQVPEGRRIFTDLTVEENLRVGGLAAGERSTRAQARERVLDLFPILHDRRAQRAGLLSGGEQQMLAIGRALMAGPRLLLLDEPSLGLAPQIVERIGSAVQQINRQGTAIVLVEQNAAMALQIADVAFVLELGQVSLHGTAEKLAETDDVRERYLGAGTTVAPPRSGASAEHTDPAPESAAATRHGRELIVDRLGVRFGGITAVDDVSFTVAPGSLHALIGPNGAGKSTCINVLSGVYSATRGSVRYGDHELTRLPSHRIAALGVSRTFQNVSLSTGATVLDNLLVARHRLTRAGFVAACLRLPSARREQAAQEEHVREVAELLELTTALQQPVHVLPFGDRKRVELARALCAEPGLLLLDEPVAGMTPQEASAMADAVRRANRRLGVSVLLIEHDMAFVMGMADRVAVLDFGRLIADGTPAEVQDDPEVLRAYLGRADQEGP